MEGSPALFEVGSSAFAQGMQAVEESVVGAVVRAGGFGQEGSGRSGMGRGGVPIPAPW
ncbi:hypothetical protein ACH40E_42935 [Streptomyces acidicola]|uniref:hypothetical protein n=1 Tax=Streptomyces acidicola TaxID=2596892 RepID=UPI0037A742B1